MTSSALKKLIFERQKLNPAKLCQLVADHLDGQVSDFRDYSVEGDYLFSCQLKPDLWFYFDDSDNDCDQQMGGNPSEMHSHWTCVAHLCTTPPADRFVDPDILAAWDPWKVQPYGLKPLSFLEGELVSDSNNSKIVYRGVECSADYKAIIRAYVTPSEAPASEAPASETPTSEAPASEAPASEAPASEAPASEAPASEAPASEAPYYLYYTHIYDCAVDTEVENFGGELVSVPNTVRDFVRALDELVTVRTSAEHELHTNKLIRRRHMIYLNELIDDQKLKDMDELTAYIGQLGLFSQLAEGSRTTAQEWKLASQEWEQNSLTWQKTAQEWQETSQAWELVARNLSQKLKEIVAKLAAKRSE